MPTHSRNPGRNGMEGWDCTLVRLDQAERHGGFSPRGESAAERLPAGACVLDVAPGPGFFAIELAKLGDFRITGLDISRTLVKIAAKNARTAGVNVDFRLGNASAMPFADESFDFVYCSAAFKNFSEPVKA